VLSEHQTRIQRLQGSRIARSVDFVLFFEAIMNLQSIRVFECAPARSDQGHLIFLFLFPSREKEKKNSIKAKEQKEYYGKGKRKHSIKEKRERKNYFLIALYRIKYN
jgi:hypothetical protein